MISCCHNDATITPDVDQFLNGTDLGDMLDCEVFTDFSDLLLDADGEPFKIPSDNVVAQYQKPEIESPVAVNPVPKNPNKRSSNVELGIDHNYHMLSSKRQKLPDNCVMEEVADAELKHIRYLERRRKNNAASKRSREIKKNRMAEMEQQVIDLEVANNGLRDRIGQLENLTTVMKSLLVQKVSAH